MDTENIYMNIHMRKPPPRSVEPEKETQPVYKNLRILYAVIILFALMLVLSLTATAILYSWEKACLWLHRKPAPCNVDNSTMLALEMEKSKLENLNASYEALQYKYRVVFTLVPEGWKLHDGNIYYFSSEKKSWAEAQQSCVSKNSNLTSVTSQEEQAFFSRTITTPYWIGLTDKGSEGTWHWVDGNPYNPSKNARFWRANQPDNWDQGKGLTEDCVHVLPGDLRSWNDENCNFNHQWICKISL
ncbi:C-type lectin domain family 4 member F-like isoform X1 [Trichosurus vulpecula]|uniref:C-type lectin domain family 4 member F-like isoform X1 n=1 Tax=Trichosurus vulpecula TaxID=9337 RepID=UPI00186AF6FA|nr:C-type lectin domain family 4 member F-like isoform X1 [Trichosurus vulpecula]